MLYLLYKITNAIDGKIYVGVHQTKNIDDKYMGSGSYLKNAINKYGKENFVKEILQIFDSADDMYDAESVVVNENFVKRKDTYNIKVGGEGGWYHLNYGILKHKNLRYNNKYQTKISPFANGHEKAAEWTKKGLDIVVKNKLGFLNTNVSCKSKRFTGKKHTDETKRRIGKINSINQKGDKNSQYGKCWIYNEVLKTSKSIDKNDLIIWTEKGWIKGRKMSF